ncbi:serologically defined colon cancer antigen 8 homolog isoform X1 [Stomoxys calcitrans]|uniref:serologically defined colon cancer antigen 8 homolog isoform X1 n=1 Tax=Stomoxys calcitrans TaxID=35570 RepID=UPI0027E29465|nr:serologically defined colon cancer antigen 8 homolog isoform X1 [Stomoxys calcitrans]
MKAEHLVSGILGQLNTPRHSSKDVQRDLNLTDLSKPTNSDLWQQQQRHHHQHHSHQRQEQQQQQQQHQLHQHHQHKHHQSLGHRRRDSLCLSDRESLCSISSSRSKRIKSRNGSMKPLKGGGINKKSRTMDYTNYAYNEAVGRLKLMLASDSYSPSKTATSSYLRGINDDSGDNYSDNMSAIDRPVYADISKYLSPSQKNRIGVTPTTNTTAAASGYRTKKALGGFSSSKENLASAGIYHSTTMPSTAALSNPTSTIDYYGSATTKPLAAAPPPTDSVQAPVEIFNFIEKQEDYIEQLEKESKYCRNELSNLLGKVKDVINENEQLTDIARSELGHLGNKCHNDKLTTSPSSDSDDLYGKSKAMTPRGKKDAKSPRFAAAPNIVYEAKISELEADLMQAHIDLKRTKTENEELKRKLSRSDPLALVSVSNSASNCEVHRKQIDLLQKDKSALEETIRHLQKALDEAKSQQYSQSSKRYINDLVQMERSQAEMEVRHLRDELDRQHERVREMQMEMARRLADERSNAERRYNNQVDQLGGDLSSQWEQVAKLQLDLERQKRYEGDLKRDLANRNSQIEELKMELRANRSTFLADMAQVNAEKQSLEQEITALRLQLDRATRENKTEAARLNAEINSLRQRLDRADADLLHSKREVLRLNDEIANLEKELAYGEMKNEIRPTKKDLDKRISELQEKHAETVNELEEMIQSQKQLMDKLTGECKTLTNKLEDTTLKHK